MDEGTRLGGMEKSSFEKRLVEKGFDDKQVDSSATKIGEISEFEKSLYEEKETTEEQLVPEKPKPDEQESSDQPSTDQDTQVTTKEELEPEKPEPEKPKDNSEIFQQELEKTVLDYQEGDIIKGIVRNVEKSGVLVDIKYKSDGFVVNSEFSNDPSETPSVFGIKQGDPIDVYIEKLETKEGYTKLSRKRAEFELAWRELIKNAKTKESFEVKVTSKVEGGLVVSFKGIRGFIPASHLVSEYRDDFDKLIGEAITATVLQADRKRKKVIFSNKFAKVRPSEEDLRKVIASLQVGDVKKGKVSSIKDFGAFVDIGGIEGLVHISELSWARVNHPSQKLSLGDDIEVIILGIDEDNQKVSLGMKQLQPDPWANVGDRYQVGQIVDGKVSRIVDFGAFVQLEKDLEGLIHISELSHSHVDKVSEVVSVGADIKARIIKVYPEEQKIGLSLKQVEEKVETDEQESSDQSSADQNIPETTEEKVITTEVGEEVGENEDVKEPQEDFPKEI